MAARSIAVAMSGGVDSTVAALLLKRTGADLIGVFMHNWDELNESGQCTSEADYAMVKDVCSQIGIPCKRANFVKEYWNDVFSYFVEEIKSGRTPNPDVICNQKIKFYSFFDWVKNNLGIETIATGHYARVDWTTEHKEARLLQSVDSFKDQTYFLSQIPQGVLQNTLFPIGHLTKSKVRRIANEAGFQRVNEKKESMGLCFVGKRNFKKFIGEYVDDSTGEFVTVSGKVVGRHKGHHLYTIGQRARLGGYREPYFVVAKNSTDNTVTVAEGPTHPALYTHSFTTFQPHWITCTSHNLVQQLPDVSGKSHDLIGDSAPSIKCLMRLRHQQPLVPCSIHRRGSGLLVCSEEPLRAVTPGQYAVFYTGIECLGGACIVKPGLSLWEHCEMNKDKAQHA